MKIYTKTGDKGTTSLIGGTRVPKHHVRIETYGSTDELNAYIGLIRSQAIDEISKKNLKKIQTNLFTVGSELATDPKKAKFKSGKDRLNIVIINDEAIEFLEQEIDRMNEKLAPITHFVLPGGHPTVSYCHIARCVCRRAERQATALYELMPFDEHILQYLNRLSDYLFVLARNLTKQLQVEEVKWIPEKKEKP